jgi:hypothetical protein
LLCISSYYLEQIDNRTIKSICRTMSHIQIRQKLVLLAFSQKRRHREYQPDLTSMQLIAFPKLAIARVQMNGR